MPVDTGEYYKPRQAWDNEQTTRHLRRYLTAIAISKPDHTDTCLDFGCGSGLGMSLLDWYYDYVQGYDKAHECSDYRSMAGWDVVYMVEVIEHIPQSEIGTIINDLRAKKLVIATPIRPQPLDNPINPYHVHEYSQEELVSLMKEFGYKCQTHLLMPVKWHTGERGQQGFFVFVGEDLGGDS